uniref:Putative secreted protein n=1 Tax=Ixodes ricinus TaxID=34613 RepID=A0A6B0U2P9_IXORI
MTWAPIWRLCRHPARWRRQRRSLPLAAAARGATSSCARWRRRAETAWAWWMSSAPSRPVTPRCGAKTASWLR